MPFNIDNLRTDRALENSGAWVEYEGDSKVKIARFGNPQYQLELRKLPRSTLLTIQDPQSVKEVMLGEEAEAKLISETVLLGWEGLIDDAGTPIPYSKEKAFELLRDIRSFRLGVTALSQNANNFKTAQKELEIKN